MGFEYLRVYQAAELLDQIILALVAGLPRGFGKDIDQLLRACSSILLNLAEAYGTEYVDKKRSHLDVARGSADEVRACLRRLVRRKAFTEADVKRACGLTHAIAKMITAWMGTLPSE